MELLGALGYLLAMKAILDNEMSCLGKVSDKGDEIIRRSIEDRSSSVQRLKKNIKIL